jgi:hypothetical protein
MRTTTMRLRFTRSHGLAVLACLLAAPALGASPNDLLPEAPAKAVIVRACTTCHQAPQIVAKPHTAEEWDSIVGRMVDRGARASEDEQDQIIAYLTEHFGPPAPAPGARKAASR